jgi:hypothetical protein
MASRYCAFCANTVKSRCGWPQLSLNYYTAYEEIRTLGLTTSPAEKFAKLLLSWNLEKGQGNGQRKSS